MKTLNLFIALVLVAGLALIVGPAPVAQAADIDVDCTTAALINAINTANSNGEPDTLNLTAGCTYTLTAVHNTTDGANGLPSITSEIIINGNGATIERSSASGTPQFRIFHVADGGDLTLNELVVSNGLISAATGLGRFGGGIFNRGAVALAGSSVCGNSASAGGGGICNWEGAVVALSDSIICDNSGAGGGGIRNERGTVKLTNSTVTGNEDGGIMNAYGTLELTHSTVSSNSSYTYGGGIFNIGGEATLTNSVVSGNSASYTGGGLANDGGMIKLVDSIVSDNSADDGGGGISNFVGEGSPFDAIATVELTNSTISGNHAFEGGGISNGGELGIHWPQGGRVMTLTNCTVSGNSATVGGGILNYTNGEMILTNSTVSGNSAFDTGGIANLPLVSGTHSNHVKLINSTVSNNDSFDGPGGISNIGTLRLTNSTVSGNKGATGGMGGYAGGIHNFTGAMVELINCTISDNSTSHHVGAGVGNPGGVVTLINTIVAGNLPAGDCYSPSYSPITSLGHNLDSDGTCNLTATGDIPNTNPLLGSLQDNGGPTETHALQSDSPAIDAGDDSACPDTDQRGVIRPLDGDGDGTATCDIGAYEFEPPTIMVPIDIKPGSDPNSINCNNKNGVIPVAILTTEDFDATAVDHTTVAFEGAGEMHVDKKSGNPRRHEEDVDGDGDIDLVFHFRLRDTGLTCDSTEGTLTGETFGQAIEGTDAVRMIDKGGGKP